MALSQLSLSRGHWRQQLRSTHSSRRPTPLVYPKSHPSLLPLVLSCTNLIISREQRWHVSSRGPSGEQTQKENLIAFYLDNQIPNPRLLGLLRPDVINAMLEDHQRKCDRTPWHISRHRGRESRKALMNALVQGWRADGRFANILKGWSDEQYPIYHPPGMTNADGPIAFSVERAALPLFGFPNFGCLMTGYFHSPSDGELRFWIPRRSRTKRTWPGRLDVTVGGGIDSASSPLSTIIRECAEEASLPPSVVEPNIRAAGVLSLPNRSPAGWILPGLYYLYDLHLPPDVQPKINEADGEVENFEVMDSRAVLNALLEGELKPSSALALVDFLIRHGHVTAENEPRYAELCLQLRQASYLTILWR